MPADSNIAESAVACMFTVRPVSAIGDRFRSPQANLPAYFGFGLALDRILIIALDTGGVSARYPGVKRRLRENR